MPAPNTAREFLAAVPAGEEPLLDALERYCRSHAPAVVVPPRGLGLVQGPRAPAADLPRRRRGRRARRPAARTSRRSRSRCARSSPQAMAEVAADSGLTAHRPDRRGPSAPSRSRSSSAAPATRSAASPALVDEGATVGLRVLGDRRRGRRAPPPRRTPAACCSRSARRPVDDVLDGLDQRRKLALAGLAVRRRSPTCSPTAGRRSSATSSTPGRPCATRRRSTPLRRPRPATRPRGRACAAALADVMRVLDAWRHGRQGAQRPGRAVMLPALTDMRAQLGRLVHPGFVGEAGPARLRRLPALPRRAEPPPRAARRAGRPRPPADGPGRRPAGGLAAPGRRAARGPAARRSTCAQVRWLLEEYRVSLWAQQLGTARPGQRPAHPQGAGPRDRRPGRA